MKHFFHNFKLFFARIRWHFQLLKWARSHKKEVENYKFLIDSRKVMHDKFLKAEREEKNEEAEKLKIQIELLDKIIKYVK